MNCLYITLFFNIGPRIVQTFIKSWNQLVYPRVIEVCRQPFESRHDFFLHLIIIALLESCLQTCMTYTIAECTVNKLLMMDRRTFRNM